MIFKQLFLGYVVILAPCWFPRLKIYNAKRTVLFSGSVICRRALFWYFEMQSGSKEGEYGASERKLRVILPRRGMSRSFCLIRNESEGRVGHVQRTLTRGYVCSTPNDVLCYDSDRWQVWSSVFTIVSRFGMDCSGNVVGSFMPNQPARNAEMQMRNAISRLRARSAWNVIL